jgi:hypothetical protein
VSSGQFQIKQRARSWRDVLPIHPAAEPFPTMSEAELREPGEDIKARGLPYPIVIYDGKLLDGCTRFDARELVGIKFAVWREDKNRFELSVPDNRRGAPS